jgi:hypothetical protein
VAEPKKEKLNWVARRVQNTARWRYHSSYLEHSTSPCQQEHHWLKTGTVFRIKRKADSTIDGSHFHAYTAKVLDLEEHWIRYIIFYADSNNRWTSYGIPITELDVFGHLH